MSDNLYPNFGILLVDDEAPFLRSMCIALERHGGFNHLYTCEDSRDAMALIGRHSIGLVLLDLTMPHLSGESLLQRILEEFPEVCVIIISGLNQLETAVQCIRLGAHDYFVKTTEEERLIEGVRRAVRLQEMRL
jgi:DNA-binding NtrC family response regulator